MSYTAGPGVDVKKAHEKRDRQLLPVRRHIFVCRDNGQCGLHALRGCYMHMHHTTTTTGLRHALSKWLLTYIYATLYTGQWSVEHAVKVNCYTCDTAGPWGALSGCYMRHCSGKRWSLRGRGGRSSGLLAS